MAGTEATHGVAEPGWLKSSMAPGLRWTMMALIAFRMALHDGQKTVGAVLGVAFAYVLIGQNISTTNHYLDQATSFVDAADVDLWVVGPAATAVWAPSTVISTAALSSARVTPGVEWAEPLVYGASFIKLPDGGAQAVILIGTTAPKLRGGPYNIIKGQRLGLLRPNAIFLDDADREKLGGVNYGDHIEVNGHRAEVAGFTWGLVTLFGPFAFAEYDRARAILGTDSDRLNCVLVRVADPASLLRVQAELRSRIPEATVLTTTEFRDRTRHFILFDAGIIGILVMGIIIGVTVGLGIVTLSMLSSVQQNLREFGTLKAIGATNADLRRLIFLQALGYSVVGSFIGAVCLCQLAWGSRSARLIMIVEPVTLVALVPFVTGISVVAAMLAIRRVQRLEPASVFR